MRSFFARKFVSHYPIYISTRAAACSLFLAMMMGLFTSQTVLGQQAKWIWSSQHINGNTPKESVHFRKRFTLPGPVVAELVIAADDEFEVYFNGELVGYGAGYDRLTKINLTPHLIDGENVIAIRATNLDGNTGAMAAIARFRLEGETAWRWLASDETWKSSVIVDQSWKNVAYSEANWPESQSLGAFGTALPWDRTRMVSNQKEQTNVQSTSETIDKNRVGVRATNASTAGATSISKNTNTATESTADTESVDRQSVPVNADTLAAGARLGVLTPRKPESPKTPPAPTPTISGSEVADVDSDSTIAKPTNDSAPMPAPPEQEQEMPVENPASESAAAQSPKASGDEENEQTIAESEKPVAEPKPREFKVPENFSVQEILGPAVGSLIAMEFNEFGQLILSREGGKLLLCDLTNSESGQLTVRVCCESMENVQGILPLNGDLFVTGDGPQGVGLYRLTDKDRDGMFEAGDRLVALKGPPGEHGPHGLTLGYDGMLYITIGNASGVQDGTDDDSPLTDFHEGDILERMADPAGHAAGIRAPGGTIVRVSLDGSRKQLFAGGIRNAYDLAFNKHGDLFIHDSDMESDIGTPWYRPTQVFHVTAGGEYGWRSGTAKFPEYFIDSIPGIADTGRGSPTGMVFYDHVMMPLRYHGSLFLGDWSEGRVLAVHMEENQDSFQTTVETFLSAEPLTVTDLAVGPDGALYFTTGGRGTRGGVYRVAWDGDVPDEFRLLDDPLSQLVGRPQPQSAWTRQEIAKIKSAMGDQWAESLVGILNETRNRTEHRLRALEILGLFGPTPGDSLLVKLTSDQDARIRERAVNLAAWRDNKELTRAVLSRLVDDSPRVRRAACETLRQLGQAPAMSSFVKSLASSSPNESMAARRLLESIPVDQWRETVLGYRDMRVFLQGATSLMVVEPELQNAYQVLARASTIMDGFVGDRDFVDLLRVIQLALDQADVDPTLIPVFHDKILAEFPSASGVLNRELSRIIGYLKDKRVAALIPKYLDEGSDDNLDKLQVILNLGDLASEFTDEQKLSVIAFIESMKKTETVTESNYGLYVDQILGRWSDQVSQGNVTEILRNGAKWPSAALDAFFKLPKDLTDEQVTLISNMDRQLRGRTDSSAMQARVGCIAVLGRSGDEQSMSYLREIWRNEKDRRDNVVLALAQKPGGENWPYLVSSMTDVSDDTAGEVLKQLATVNQRPEEPRFLRDTILTGYRLRAGGAAAASDLLHHWTGRTVMESTPVDDENWKSVMHTWANWFNEQYPNEEPVAIGQSATDSVSTDQTGSGKYTVDQILSHMENSNEPVNMLAGMAVFSKAQCANCHRLNGKGESIGPNLSSLARRFSRRETLESILHPSDNISSQYQASKVLTTDGLQHLGLVSRAGIGKVRILTDKGEKLVLAKDEIEEITKAQVSAMPEGLLDELSLDEINSLMQFLYSKNGKTANKPATNNDRR